MSPILFKKTWKLILIIWTNHIELFPFYFILCHVRTQIIKSKVFCCAPVVCVCVYEWMGGGKNQESISLFIAALHLSLSIQLIGKDPDVGRDWGQEEKGTTEDEMAGWHHWLDGHESEWTPGVGDAQGGLVCCNSWGRKESDTTEQLNWTELIQLFPHFKY